MSKLSQRKSKLVVETDNAVYDRRRQREIVVELKPGHMVFRLKGTRQSYVLSYTSALNLAIRNEVARRRLEKAKKTATGSPR
jgi:hypothetical protein